MPKYIDDCNKIKGMIEHAFPDITPEQIDAIDSIARACIVRGQSHVIVDTAMKTLFPNAKFGMKRITGTKYNGVEYDFDKQYCKEVAKNI